MNTLITLILLYIFFFIINFIILSIRFHKTNKTFNLILIFILSLRGFQLLIIMLLFQAKGRHLINKYEIDNNSINSW